jgi:hypothetical protein
VLAACVEGKKRRGKGSSGIRVALPFYTGVAGWGGNGWRRAVWGRRHASGVWGVARRGGRAAAGADDHTE